MDVGALERKSKAIRRRIIETLAVSHGGHYGGCLSCVEILTSLYLDTMRIDPRRPAWPDRDRFVLSKGHACAALCAVLAERGFFPAELLQTFNELDSPFGMHPDMHRIPGCDMSTGSLGHGLPVAVGMALAGKLDRKDYRVFVLVGDGECHEGTNWEAMMAASRFELDNVVVIIDRNRVCMDGFTEQIMPLGELGKKVEAFGWAVREIDGHDVGAVRDALRSVPFESKRPSAVIANTVKGKGVPFMENTAEWHHREMTAEATADVTARALRELE